MNRKMPIPAIALIGSLMIGLMMFGVVNTHSPTYLTSPWENHLPDAVDYLKLGKSIRESGAYSRTDDGRPDILRTPMYPLMLAGLNAHHNTLLLYCVQLGMLAVLIALIVAVTQNCFGSLSAILAMVLLWTDYRLFVLCVEAMSEISSLFMLMVGLFILGWPTFPRGATLTWPRSMLAAVSLSISAMIRPALLYLPLVIAIIAILCVRSIANGSRYSKVASIIGFSIVFMICPALWTLRNWTVFGVPKLTTVSTHNLIYFVGAGAFQTKFGIDRYRAQAMLAEQYPIPSYTNAQNPYSQDKLSVRELEDLLHESQWKIVFAHPVSLVYSTIVGICKASVDHSLVSVSNLLSTEWLNPGLKELVTLQPEAWNRLFRNHAILVTAFFAHLLHTAVLWIGFSFGVLKSLIYRRPVAELAGLWILFIYGTLVIGMFGIDAIFRSTVIALPAVVMLAGYSVAHSGRDQMTPISP